MYWAISSQPGSASIQWPWPSNSLNAARYFFATARTTEDGVMLSPAPAIISTGQATFFSSTFAAFFRSMAQKPISQAARPDSKTKRSNIFRCSSAGMKLKRAKTVSSKFSFTGIFQNPQVFMRRPNVLRTESLKARMPAGEAGFKRTRELARPRPPRIWASSPPMECPMMTGGSSSLLISSSRSAA